MVSFHFCPTCSSSSTVILTSNPSFAASRSPHQAPSRSGRFAVDEGMENVAGQFDRLHCGAVVFKAESWMLTLI